MDNSASLQRGNAWPRRYRNRVKTHEDNVVFQRGYEVVRSLQLLDVVWKTRRLRGNLIG